MIHHLETAGASDPKCDRRCSGGDLSPPLKHATGNTELITHSHNISAAYRMDRDQNAMRRKKALRQEPKASALWQSLC